MSVDSYIVDQNMRDPLGDAVSMMGAVLVPRVNDVQWSTLCFETTEASGDLDPTNRPAHAEPRMTVGFFLEKFLHFTTIDFLSCSVTVTPHPKLHLHNP